MDNEDISAAADDDGEENDKTKKAPATLFV